MVASSDAPLLLLDGELAIVAASDSFCDAFEIQRLDVSGQSFFELGAGEWNLPKLRSLLTATASGLAAIKDYEIDLSAPRAGQAPPRRQGAETRLRRSVRAPPSHDDLRCH